LGGRSPPKHAYFKDLGLEAVSKPTGFSLPATKMTPRQALSGCDGRIDSV